MIKFLLFIFVGYQLSFANASTFKSVRIETGDTVLSILRKNGFSESQRQSFLKKWSSLKTASLFPKNYYLVSKVGGRVEMKMFDSVASRAWYFVKDGDKINSTEFIPNYQTQLKKIGGRAKGSVYSQILDKTDSHWIASRFQDAFNIGADKNLNLKKNDPFILTIEKKFYDGQFIRFGEIVNAKIKTKNKTIQKTFVKIGRGGIFINANDLELKKPFYAPVDYIRISSQFQPARRHPITGRVQPHLGVDFELPKGEPVYAAKSGTVVRFGRHHAAGNYVVILHGKGMESSYNHLDSINKNLRIGMRISSGQKIGTVGCTGYCTKPHLHFALKLNGRMINPVGYINPYPIFAKNKLENRLAAN